MKEALTLNDLWLVPYGKCFMIPGAICRYAMCIICMTKCSLIKRPLSIKYLVINAMSLNNCSLGMGN